jgi:hypothetical protein
MLLTQQPYLNFKEVFSYKIGVEKAITFEQPLLRFLKLEKILYRRTVDETLFLSNLQQLSNNVSECWTENGSPFELVKWAASSSMFTVETMLYRLLSSWKSLRNKIAHYNVFTKEDILDINKQLTIEMETLDFVNVDARLPSNVFNVKQFLAFYTSLERLVDEVQSLPSDLKIESLTKYLESCKLGTSTRVCILTAFSTSVQYISATLRKQRQESLCAKQFIESPRTLKSSRRLPK